MTTPISARGAIAASVTAWLLPSSWVTSYAILFSFFFNDTATPEIYTLSLHDALPISRCPRARAWRASRSASKAILAGRLCSSAGRQCSSARQPRRARISRRCPPRAPQALTTTGAAGGSAGERQLRDETVVEVGAVGQLDIPHLLKQRQPGGPLAQREQRHLGPLAGHVPGAHHAQHPDLGDQAEPDRVRRGQVAAERARQQHLLDVAGLQARLLDQDAPAGGDRRLGELEFPHVPLGQVDRLRDVAGGAEPVQIGR